MGKPFEKELDLIDNTYNWAINQIVEELKADILYNKLYPLFVVGSGGSLSACYYAATLYQQLGLMAKAVTPLELFYSQNALINSNVLFISASGKNTDILFSYKKAVSLEPHRVYSICMKKGTALSKLAMENSISRHFEYENPAGKDGFLATNSLVAFFTILFKTFATEKYSFPSSIKPDKAFLAELKHFLEQINNQYTFNVLAAGYGYPVAIDIESKLVEAALSDVIVSDYRNFGHGRHHWFAKRMNNSAIIAIITPNEELIAKKTIALLPPDIPILIIRTDFSGAFGSIDLLVRSFYFVRELGKLQNIDPGRPGVPEYGSKLYNLRYNSLLKEKKEVPDLEKIAILRKTKLPSIELMSDTDLKFWRRAYKRFKDRITGVRFGAVIFDYDGTLCSSTNRFTGIEESITDGIILLLKEGLSLGIATGRGQSVQLDLRKKIPKKFWSNVIVGYYNCSDIIPLSEDRLPTKTGIKNERIKQIYADIQSYAFPEAVSSELKPNQVTIEIKQKGGWQKVRPMIIDLILSKNYLGIQILESSHSIDIIDQTSTSKLSILSLCSELSKASQKEQNCLCIGDKGQWPGNDYLLLSSTYSLSVDEVSSLSETCWSLAPAGIKNVKATEYYLSFLTFSKAGATISLP